VISSSPPNATAPEKRHALRHPTAGETTLYLVRHGRTESNQRNVMVGITDVPLDAVGVGQARAIAERLASEVDADVLLASPLSRAFETARIIGARIGLTPVARPDVVEIDFGDLEGVSIDRFLEDHSSRGTGFSSESVRHSSRSLRNTLTIGSSSSPMAGSSAHFSRPF